jgi:hypothetical protein
MKLLTDSEKIEICQKYQEGQSLMKLNKEYHTTSPTVKKILKENNIELRDHKVYISDDLLNKIKEEYFSTKISFHALAKKYDIHPDTLNYRFSQMGWELKSDRPITSFSKLSEEMGAEIIKLYLDGLSGREIGKKLNYCYRSVQKYLVKNKIPRRSKSESVRTYDLNENYFEKIDTPEKAYFLGFIYAEGHSEKNGKNTLTIGLQHKDKYILEQLKEILGSNRPLEFRSRQADHWDDVSVLRVGSLKLLTDLQKLGIPLGKKSDILQFPNKDILPRHLIKYFILGEVDGDGHIGFDKNHQFVFNVAGAFNLLKGIQEYLNENLGTTIKYKERNTVTAIIEKCSNREVFKILNWLYKDLQTPFLIRKYEVYKRGVNYILNTKSNWLNSTKNLALEAKKIIEENGK